MSGQSQDRKGRQRSKKINRRGCLTDSCPDREREGKFCIFLDFVYVHKRLRKRWFFFFFYCSGLCLHALPGVAVVEGLPCLLTPGPMHCLIHHEAPGEPCWSSSDGSDWQPPVGEPGPAPHTWGPLGWGTAWKEEVPASQCGCRPQFREHGPFSLLERPGSSDRNSPSGLQSPKQGSWVRTRKPGGLK